MSEQDQILQSVRRVLMQEWDPIGVRNVPQARDEYDKYADQLVKMLYAGMSSADLMAYLSDIETNAMRLQGDSERARAVSIALLKIANR